MSVEDCFNDDRVASHCLPSIILVIAFSVTLSSSTAVAANLKQAPYPNQQVTYSRRLQNPTTPTTGTGTLYGFVFDPMGAVIAGARVSITNFAGEHRYGVTSSEGEYRFTELAKGVYQLKIESDGFESRQIPSVTVRADDNNRLDQRLNVAPVQAEITVDEKEIVAIDSATPGPADALVKAAHDDDLEELKTLLLSRSDVNVRDSRTQGTALEYAVQSGNREMLQVLLWAKVDVNAKDKHGETPLMLLNDKATSEFVWDLINAGAKVNSRDNTGDTPLISVADENNVEVLKVLLDAGAKVNATNNDGMTALMVAAENGLVQNVRALILAGADVNARNKHGQTAMRLAFLAGESAVVRLLQAHGAIEFEPKEKP
jgi:hypothetical protein